MTGKLYSTSDLHAMYGCSRNSIVRALDRLEAAGLQIERCGRGGQVRLVRAEQLPLLTSALLNSRRIKLTNQPAGATT